MEAVKYVEIASAKISDSRNVVISACSKGGFTVAQQLVAEEASGKTNVFMKGAFHVSDVEGLYNMRDALNMAIDYLENGSSWAEEGGEEEEWDPETIEGDCK